MTISQLYSIYCAGYVEVRTLSEGGPLRPADAFLKAPRPSALERVILELAVHDATNGTAMRSRAAFDRAVVQGAALLRGLGLSLEGDRVAPALENAASTGQRGGRHRAGGSPLWRATPALP